LNRALGSDRGKGLSRNDFHAIYWTALGGQVHRRNVGRRSRLVFVQVISAEMCRIEYLGLALTAAELQAREGN
jgi:hypothetical protein